MSLKKLSMIFLAGAMLLGTNSCNKTEDTATSPSLEGNLYFSVPAFVQPGTRITMTPHGVTHPEGEEIGYYWKVSPTMTQYDTTRFLNGLNKEGIASDGSFTHTFSDTLKTYTIYAYAFADGYYSKSGSDYCSVVSGGLEESITKLNISSIATSHEVIGGDTYYYTTAGGNDWLMRNISNPDAGTPYYNCTAMSEVFGRYYSYNEALTICPEGWTLPTDEDWAALALAAGAETADSYSDIKGVAAALMGNADFNDVKMWEYWPVVGDITNNTGMSMIPVGYAMLGNRKESTKTDPNIEYNYPNAIFKGYQEYAVFWTADKVQNEEGMAYYRYLICDQPDLLIAKGDMNTFGASVRCVRQK